ncbi:tigger transposable element-derived protein 6-like [Latimeria chalumnae]|uniref:tigger transposable element-derived protein 6-like n=1 Tax=Latimeria chalumnae TaxID=7897 RepID=UPI00313EF34B
MPPPAKRQRTNVNAGQKQHLCQHKAAHLQLAEMRNWAKTTLEIEVGTTTMHNILKSSEKWLAVTADSVDTIKSRHCKHPEMEDALFMWFTEVWGRGAAVNDEMLLEKGRVLGERLGVQDFAYSKGWLANFKSRRGINHHRLHGEAASADVTAIVAGRAELQQTLAYYSPHDIYNFDETGLFYKLGPSGTLATAPVAGHKKSKERITPTLYTEYFSNAKAWMTLVIFQEIIRTFDRDLCFQGRQCILLLDIASSYTVTGMQLTNLKLHFLPPCTTSSIQPLDTGIIRAFKAHYRHQLVQLYVNCAEEGRIQTVDLCQALKMIRLAWRNVTASTVNCWHHTGILPCDNTATDNDEDDMTLAEIQQLIRRLDPAAGPNAAAEYASIDREVETMQELDDDTIVDSVNITRRIMQWG